MSFTLEFLPAASVEFKDAIRYYEACVPDLGVRFRLEVERSCAAIVKEPLLWRERPGHRRVNLRGFPYYIAYFIRGDILIVAAVAHASRDPDYWKQRDWS
jgi:plasmid stabilization system protein ParE